MKKTFIPALTLALFVISSCTSIPKSSVKLSEEIMKESKEMHKLNIALIKQLFEERRNAVNSFINNKYLPKVVSNYKKLLPEDLDYKEQLPKIIENIVPVLLRKKDSLQSLLEKQENEFISVLSDNYTDYSRATYVLHDLITSGAKLQEEQRQTLNSIKNLTGQEINVDKIQQSIEGFYKNINTKLNQMVSPKSNK